MPVARQGKIGSETNILSGVATERGGVIPSYWTSVIDLTMGP
jgi:hypothetical protein